MSAPTLSKIRIYPIKSLDFVEVDEIEVGKQSLRGDREFAIVDTDGRVVNGKRTGRVNQLRASYDLEQRSVGLVERGSDARPSLFNLDLEQNKIDEYLSEFFGFKVQIVQRNDGSLMDIPGEASVSVVSEASLRSLWAAFPEMTLEQFRARFRANLEIADTTPFWEDLLYGEPGHAGPFAIDDVELLGVSPRARCNVPPRDPNTGTVDKTFARRMMALREKSAPAGTHLFEYGGPYQLTVNTFIADSQRGKKLRRGAVVTTHP